mgnify:CR=1 FL=1
MPELLRGIFALSLLVILLLGLNTKIVQNNKAIVIERLGRFLKIIDQPGFYFTIPVVDRVVQTVPLDIQENKFVIDSKEDSIKITLSINYKIFDVKLFVYAELDSLSKLEEYITQHINLTDPISEQDSHLVKEYAESLGIEIIKMCVE